MRFTAGPPGGSGRGGVARAADIPVRCHADTTSCMIMELYANTVFTAAVAGPLLP